MNSLQTNCRPDTTEPRPAADGHLLAAGVKDLAGWDRVYGASALAYYGGWIVAGRWGRLPGVAVGFPNNRAPAWAAAVIPGQAEARTAGAGGPPSLPKDPRASGTTTVRKQAGGVTVCIVRADPPTLAALRGALPFLQPRVTGRAPSFGFGDRLGLATPGHLAALRGSALFPILAQQSIREMTRTRRAPDEVMDAAVFGALQCGWTAGFGADADHLKTPEDVDRMAEAGFVFFTLDPSAFVDDTVRQSTDADLGARYREAVGGVPGADRWEAEYLDRPFSFAGPAGPFTVTLDGRALREAAVKYGRAAAHAADLAARVRERMAGRPYEIEVSVDETAVPTTPGEHLFIARELRARGAAFHSLALRFIGDFEKGIDYKGDLDAFERSIERHAAIAGALGDYKISVHSGSDKFSAYPAVARATGGRFHVKTAGTSYLEALRVVARKDPAFFREIAEFARGRYEQDRATYHVSARLDRVPAPAALKDAELERAYLEDEGGRQVLHVTFGSVLTVVADAAGTGRGDPCGRPDGPAVRAGTPASAEGSGGVSPKPLRGEGGSPAPPGDAESDRQPWLFRERLLDLLVREEDTYTEVLARHLGKHVRLLTGS